MYRYLTFVWTPDASSRGASLNAIPPRLMELHSHWELVYEGPGVRVFQTGARSGKEEAHTLANRSGVVLGTLFRKQNATLSNLAPVQLEQRDSEEIVRSGGRALVERYWGRYVAIFRDEAAGSLTVMRDPSAAIACFHSEQASFHVFFSHYEDFLRFVPFHPSINIDYLAAYLVRGEHLTRASGISGIEDLPGGEALQLTRRGARRLTLWHPGQFCSESTLEDPDFAARRLRETVQDVITAWSSCYRNIVLRLSGGLDSSIVATCLANMNSAPRVTCLNYYMATMDANPSTGAPDPRTEDARRARRMMCNADEREFARQVAERTGYPLVEQERRWTSLDLRRIWGAPLAVRPSKFVISADRDDFEAKLSQQVGADGLFSGLGGDAVFYCTWRPMGAIDYVRRHPLGRHLLREVAASARLSGESAWAVISKALRHGLLRKPMPYVSDFSDLAHLLKDDVHARVIRTASEHPWLYGRSGWAPGKELQVQNLISAGLFYPFVFHAEKVVTYINPLVSQPVLELCLQIPTYTLLVQGISRGLARRAFSDLLPEPVRRRTLKGVFAGLEAQALRHNVEFARDTLIDGLLVREGLLDRKKLTTYLVKEQTYQTVSATQIFFYLAGEAWLQQCRDVKQIAAA